MWVSAAIMSHACCDSRMHNRVWGKASAFWSPTTVQEPGYYIPSKIWDKTPFQRFQDGKRGLAFNNYFSQPEISDHLYIYLHLLTSLPLHNYKSPQLLFFARWNKPGLLASPLHVPLSSDWELFPLLPHTLFFNESIFICDVFFVSFNFNNILAAKQFSHLISFFLIFLSHHTLQNPHLYHCFESCLLAVGRIPTFKSS